MKSDVSVIRLGVLPVSMSRRPKDIQLFICWIKTGDQGYVRANGDFTRSVQIDWQVAECGSQRFVHAVETASRF
jgi:hypothetical protein